MPAVVNKLNLLNMSRTGSLLTHKFRSVVDIIHAPSFQSTYGIPPRNSPILSAAKLGKGYWMHPVLQMFSTNSNTSIGANGVKNVKVQPPALASPSFNFPYWLKWVFGSVLSLLLPFWKQYWKKLQRIEGEAEFVVDDVEKVANVVEKVAMVAKKASEEVAKNFPEDGKIKNAALVVERVSKQAAHDAQVTQEFIHKVDQVKNDLDELESYVEPMIDNIVNNEYESERK